ncbi:MAG: hypothetical protein A4E47_00157 [Methanosaeta sp. PtaU1.Bin028]|nr:MAG: hypothetical protein A4E47_00157 [Methanosaeta sp. PtaU1.Bin028]
MKWTLILVSLILIGAALGAMPEDDSAPALPPCADQGVDFEPRDPTDPYSAGPSLVPGWYDIWCGPRTSDRIGEPDRWTAYGPVELRGGQFYVFDAATSELSEPDPEMVEAHLSGPSPSEALIWFRLSPDIAYVTCLEGAYASEEQLKANHRSRESLAGDWKMTGHQEGFNGWKADLTLIADGSLSWTETDGANAGAYRLGSWQYDGTLFTMEWTAPQGGQSVWQSRSVKRDRIENGNYTVEYATGGRWEATRVGALAGAGGELAGRWSHGSVVVTITKMENGTYRLVGTDGGFEHSGIMEFDGMFYHGYLYDTPGRCCGNDGEAWIKVLDDNSYAATSRWWPKSSPRPDPVEQSDYSGWEIFQREV